MFRTRETRPGPGALYTPGTAVPARPRVHPVTAACRLAAAGPCHPGASNPSRDVSLTRHQQGFTGVRPSRPFPSPVAPGRNGDPWALPRASHPAEQDPAAHAGAGTGLRHWPGVTSSPSQRPPSTHSLTTSDLTSQFMAKSAPVPGVTQVWLPRNLPEPERSSPLTPSSRSRGTQPRGMPSHP